VSGSRRAPLTAGFSARRRRRIDQLGIDGLQSVRPRQLRIVDLPIRLLFALRPTAQAAEIAVIDFVGRDRPVVGIPLVLGGLLAQPELGGRIGGDVLEIPLGDVAALDVARSQRAS